MRIAAKADDGGVQGVLTKHHEYRLDGVKGNLGQQVIRNTLVLGEAVEDAAGGVCVKEAEGSSQHMHRHLLVHQRRSPTHARSDVAAPAKGTLVSTMIAALILIHAFQSSCSKLRECEQIKGV